MNDPQLVIEKLKKLANEAMAASTEIDRAAIFGAVRAFANDLGAGDPGNLAENIERARWSICAILGYDVTNGHSKAQHLSWALAALVALERGFSRS
jgi:hypothetical protein